jgi:hypothetical protein
MTILSGWMVYVDSMCPAGYTPFAVGEHETVSFEPKTDHVLLLGPGAVVQVTAWGDPYGEVELKPGSPYWRVFEGFGEGDLRHIWERQQQERDRGKHFE